MPSPGGLAQHVVRSLCEKESGKSLQGRRVATALRAIASYHAIQVEPSRNPEKVLSSHNIVYELLRLFASQRVVGALGVKYLNFSI